MIFKGILVILFLSFISLKSQIISFDKDSLNIQWSDENYTECDTIIVSNIGDIDLFIDSIKTINGYGYRIYRDSVSSSSSYVIGFDKPPVNINLPPYESILLIIADPDLCPFCKAINVQQFFTDSLIFVSNSLTGKYNIIDIKGDGPSDVNDNINTSRGIKLFQNYPNPFNPITNIIYRIPSSSSVRIIVYDILGNEVKILVDENKSVGEHKIQFDASNLSSGVYYYRIFYNEGSITRKLLLLK